MIFKKAILETRENYNSRTEDHMKYDRIEPSPWMLASQFNLLFEHQDVLFSEGSVVWATIIQANGKLYHPGLDDLPAVILYSLDKKVDSDPTRIIKVARTLAKIKGKKTDKDLQEFSDMLESEHTRKWKVPVPLRISKNIQCFYTTGLIVRDHIPKGYLQNVLFPYLVCPEKTKVGTILPSRYWSERFLKRYWILY